MAGAPATRGKEGGRHARDPEQFKSEADVPAVRKEKHERKNMISDAIKDVEVTKIHYSDGKIKWIERRTYWRMFTDEKTGKQIKRKMFERARMVCLAKNGKILVGKLPAGEKIPNRKK